MITFERAEAKLNAAMDRLEAAIGGMLARRGSDEDGEAGHGGQGSGSLAQDCEQLRAECDHLRRRLAAVSVSHATLRTVAGDIEGQLDEAIARLEGLTEE